MLTPQGGLSAECIVVFRKEVFLKAGNSESSLNDLTKLKLLLANSAKGLELRRLSSATKASDKGLD